MQVIIPAAGIGKRLRPLTDSMPKPLLPVAGKPILGHIVDELVDAGVDHVILIIGYLGSQIKEWAEDTYPSLRIDCVVQEKMDGLASAVYLAKPVMDDGRTLVVLGDTLFKANLNSVAGIEENMIAVKKVDDPARFGVVVQDIDGLVTRLVEKPEKFVSDLAITGIYSFTDGKALMDSIHSLIESAKTTKGEYQLTDAMQLMLETGYAFGTFEIEGWYDCGTADTLLDTNRILLKAMGGGGAGAAHDSLIRHPVHIAGGAVIRSSDIGPFVSIGAGCCIDDSTIHNSIVLPGTSVSGKTLEDMIIGPGCFLTGTPAIVIPADSPDNGN